MDKALQLIARHAEEGARLRKDFFAAQGENLAEAARHIATTIASGGKILFAGNGGSAADAQHWAAELVNRFLMDRPPLPAIALTTDTSILTAIGNDFGFEQIFSKQVQALGREGDVFIGISTSGNSQNIVEALEVAHKQGLYSIGITGNGGGKMGGMCDLLLPVAHPSTPLVQEIHAAIGHMLCALTDYYLFENVAVIHDALEQAGSKEKNHAHI